jgi:hypothetical protein
VKCPSDFSLIEKKTPASLKRQLRHNQTLMSKEVGFLGSISLKEKK